MEAEAIKSEEDSQKSYEEFVKGTNFNIEAKSKDVVNKSEEKAKAEEAKVEAEKELESTMAELEQLNTYKATLHGSCDFLMKNYDLRQSRRTEEIYALQEAKAVLATGNHPAQKFQEHLS